MDLTLKLDADAFLSGAERLGERDVRQAGAWALTDTAQDVLEHIQDQMDQVFDRPTRFTKNALMVWRATPRTLEASVVERPSVGRRHFLKVQETGGTRPQTALEKLLDDRLAYAGDLRAAVPAAGAKTNAFGNWQVGERNRALSAVQAQRDGTANTTAASRKRNRKRAGFFVPRKGSKLSPGIWRRDRDGGIEKVLHFTALAPHYEARLGFLDGAETVRADRLPVHLDRILTRMAAKAAGG